ncbi:MAG: flavin reductase [Candidatus Fermentibacteraceae bacterium]|nr:flavin reductase [Candidatus Fermentibacteraceae bacterium]MBN2609473.1 flavin reductase [Candidatus Fermentibacteraceae bacterium]
MNLDFRELEPVEINDNVFRLIAEDWFLLTAGTPSGGYNTMTASWGGMGELWNRKVSFVFVRPQRYTMRFMEKNGLYTMSFFDRAHRQTLNFCGSHTGRDVDKAEQTGLSPFQPREGATAFRQARLILVCRKLYHQDLRPDDFLEDWIEELYPEQGYHRMYIGAIEEVLIRDSSEQEALE